MSKPVGRNNAKIITRNQGGGNKLQGLAPGCTAFYIAQSTGQSYYTETGDGRNRNLVICVNQLGGIGRHRSQFRPNADGNRGTGCNSDSGGVLTMLSIVPTTQQIRLAITGTTHLSIAHIQSTLAGSGFSRVMNLGPGGNLIPSNHLITGDASNIVVKLDGTELNINSDVGIFIRLQNNIISFSFNTLQPAANALDPQTLDYFTLPNPIFNLVRTCSAPAEVAIGMTLSTIHLFRNHSFTIESRGGDSLIQFNSLSTRQFNETVTIICNPPGLAG